VLYGCEAREFSLPIAETCASDCDYHSSDYWPAIGQPGPSDRQGDWRISFQEVLRMIQLYNAGSFHCDASTEDGYAPGSGDASCTPHASDYWGGGPDWQVQLAELLRLIQLYNTGCYQCQSGTEDGFAPGCP